MSYEVKINAANESSITLMLENPHTLRDILAREEVLEFFDTEDAQEILDNLVEYNDNEVGDGVRTVFLNSSISESIVIGIDLDGTTPEGEDADVADGAAGHCKVISSGGARSTLVAIQNGVTTLHDAIYNDTVRASSGMTNTQLSNCDVTVNNNPTSNLDGTTVRDGDEIVLTVRSAMTKAQ